MITLLEAAELPALVAHYRRIRGTPRTDDELITHPYDPDAPIDEAATIAMCREGWGRAPDEPQWLRTWGLTIEGEVRGHLQLAGGRLPAELHRATVGMALEPTVRRRGHGRALLDTAIRWSRNAELAWLDLSVFAHNAPARALYFAAGFREIGTTRDRFRVESASIDDIAMALAL